ncbi:hypothetical protein [Roseixanthobacter pseudopolyaromaticivorans]|uniref:hypothetical protein n=1 Tax=Xanthobacteraceae TaxID=335928 RepID=UPI003728BAF1
MNTFTKTLTIASTLVVMAASNAFADPYIGPENEQQYAVSRQESLLPMPAEHHKAVHAARAEAPNAPAFNAQSGPAFDPDVN